ncbi:hypothetical protein PENTCL1PPCAC_11483 [Pristionchus entomophagus]|uniref:Uncharacterized protein n=1 Tax=Pristionchus entomophagus TaxID=358040 RepID=A0AAV5T905_9BILA|nr:hypothetical protein PENTCL1PPCAC_11479 [Pristionchus entomophagus]GMS89308.1 hypothetical protein PENTCL1PPCAC_11483 [Pristionchus entomophagus]
MRHSSLALFGFKKPRSQSALRLDRLLFDGLHLIQEGMCADLIKGISNSKSPWKVERDIGLIKQEI